MTSLEDILYYLDTTAIVSCPQITQAQAAEIAKFICAQEEALEYERNERDRIDERSEESPLVNRLLKKWLEEANRDRGELTKQVYKLQSEVELLEGDLSGSEFQLHETENLQQAACGFAWDCGREIVGLRENLMEYIERDRPRPMAWPNIYPAQTTGDIDPGVYEGTGKGFEK